MKIEDCPGEPKIIAIIPAPPNSKFSECNTATGDTLVEPVLCLALVELHDGTRVVAPVDYSGEVVVPVSFLDTDPPTQEPHWAWGGWGDNERGGWLMHPDSDGSGS